MQTSGTVSSPAEQLGAIASSVAIGLFVVALLLLPAGVRRGQRIARLRRLRDDWGSPRLAWRELHQTARDLAMAAPDTETPRGFAARVAAAAGDDSVALLALDSLLAATEREEYGRPGHGILDADRADELKAVLAAMLSAAGPAARIRALLIPLSLLPDTRSMVRSRARLSA